MSLEFTFDRESNFKIEGENKEDLGRLKVKDYFLNGTCFGHLEDVRELYSINLFYNNKGELWAFSTEETPEAVKRYYKNQKVNLIPKNN